MNAEPDVDRMIDYPTHNRTRGRARLRVWLEEHVAVLSDAPDNPGMSITNAAEFAWLTAEESLSDERLSHPSWRLVEHYPPGQLKPATYDVVTFSGRDTDGVFRGPSWAPLQVVDIALWTQLVEALGS